MYDPNKYKYYTDGENKIVAVSTYAGRTVRGIAKCDPRDKFDLEKGKALAAARCSVKVAEKKRLNAMAKFLKAGEEYRKAAIKMNHMRQYVDDSFDLLKEELENLEKISADL